jgi:hypothetical protein
MGTPTAAILIVTTGSSDGTKADHACISIGMVATNVAQSLTTQIASYAFSEDNVATADSARNHNTTRVIRLPDHAGSGITFLCEASFNSWITDGIRINWDALPSTAFKVEIILFGGSGLAAGLVTSATTPASINGTTTHTVDFEPEIIITTKDLNPARELVATLGVSDGTNNACVIVLSDFNSANGNTRAVAYNDRVYATWVVNDPAPDTEGSSVSLVNFTSTGFDAKTLIAATANSVAALCLNFGGAAFAINTGFSDPTGSSAGNQAYTWPGHLTGFLLAAQCVTNATGTKLTAMGLSIGATDQQTSSAQGIHDEHNAATMNTGSIADQKVSRLLANDGTALATAEWVSAQSTGFTLNWTTNPATARFGWALSVEEYVASGTSAVTLPEFTSAATGVEKFISSAVALLENFTAVATGVEKFAGTATALLENFTADLAGAEIFTSTATVLLPPFTTDLVGVMQPDGTIAISLPAFTAALSGLEIFTATATTVLPPFTAALVGLMHPDGTIAITLPAFIVDLDGNVVAAGVAGSAAITLPAFTVQLTGAEIFTASVIVTLPAFTAQLTGAEIFTASVVVTLPMFVADAVGVQAAGISATAALVLPAFVSLASLVEKFLAEGTLVLPAFEAEGSDVEELLVLVDLFASYSTIKDLVGTFDLVAPLEATRQQTSELSGGKG